MDKQTKNEIKILAKLKRYKDEQKLNGEQIAQTIEVNEAIEDKVAELKSLKRKIKHTNIVTLISLFILIIILLYSVIVYLTRDKEPEPIPVPDPLPVHIAQEYDFLISVNGVALNQEDLSSYTSQELLNLVRNNSDSEITCNEFTKIGSENDVHFINKDANVTYYSYDEAFEALRSMKPTINITSSRHQDGFKSNIQYIAGDYTWGYPLDYSCQLVTSEGLWLGFSDKSIKTIIENNQDNISVTTSEDVLVFSSDEEVNVNEILSGVDTPSHYVITDNSKSSMDYFNDIKAALESDSRLVSGANKEMNYIYYIGLDYTLADEIYTMYLLGL